MKTLPLLFAVLLVPILGHAADYLGAGRALERAAELARSGAETPPTPATNSPRELREALAAFGAAAPSLPPAKAARQWLDLVNRPTFSRAPRSYADLSGPLQFWEFVQQLPPPAAWPDLRPDLPADAKDAPSIVRIGALRWFAGRLAGSAEALQKEYRALTDAAKLVPPARRESFDRNLDALLAVTLPLIPDAGTRASLLDERLAAAIATAQVLGPAARSARLEVPDIAHWLEPRAAEAWLATALTSYPGVLEFKRRDRATFALAAKVAEARLEDLAGPQWALSATLEGGPLFDAMRNRFLAGGQRREEWQQAQTFAFYRALLADDLPAAIRLAEAGAKTGREFDDYRALEQLTNSARAPRIAASLTRLLAEKPSLPLWTAYIRIAAAAGATDEMRKLVDSTLARPDLPATVRRTLEEEHVAALLAADDAEAAVKVITAALAAGPNFELALRLARVGHVLDRPDWLQTGINAARSALATGGDMSVYNAQNLAGLLLEAGRGAEAEGVWIDALAQLLAENARDPLRRYRLQSDGPRILAGLVGVYTAAGRSADVLALLAEATTWGAPDLAKILDTPCPLGDRRKRPLAVCVAQALAQTGENARALAMLEGALPFVAGNDAAFELLVKLRGAGALPNLERLARELPFQERPLIWKATLELAAGQIDAAERTARAAIEIDPSDGEEGPGDRMRVYAVLADALAANGNETDARMFRRIVDSIRLSERGDAFYEAGLLKRAIGLYEEAVALFADAYCVQSRLALRLSQEGNWDAAEAHYRKAYELMPASFGRVESHCFGCEGAFTGARQQSIAEEVFARLAREQPDNPRVHYLRGYLANEQGKPAEAVAAFRRAVELDPDYLNAWKKLADVPTALLTPAEHTRVVRNLLRLAPNLATTSLSLTGVGDLAAAWTAITDARAVAPKRPATLFPLPASADALAAAPEAPEPSFMRRLLSPEQEATPGAIFAAQSFTDAAGNTIEGADALR